MPEPVWGASSPARPSISDYSLVALFVGGWRGATRRMSPEYTEMIAAIAIGVLSAIFLSAFLILIVICRRQRMYYKAKACGNQDEVTRWEGSVFSQVHSDEWWIKFINLAISFDDAFFIRYVSLVVLLNQQDLLDTKILRELLSDLWKMQKCVKKDRYSMVVSCFLFYKLPSINLKFSFLYTIKYILLIKQLRVQ